MNFNQSSYTVMEGDGTVVIPIILSQASSMQIQVEINTMDGTATSNIVARTNTLYVLTNCFVSQVQIMLEA